MKDPFVRGRLKNEPSEVPEGLLFTSSGCLAVLGLVIIIDHIQQREGENTQALSESGGFIKRDLQPQRVNLSECNSGLRDFFAPFV